MALNSSCSLTMFFWRSSGLSPFWKPSMMQGSRYVTSTDSHHLLVALMSRCLPTPWAYLISDSRLQSPEVAVVRRAQSVLRVTL